jgi:hypothetical protein
MPNWPVYVEGWQLECCGAPFAVGDEVEWTLMLTPDPSLPAELLVDFSGNVEQTASDEKRSGCIVRSGELRAWVEGTGVTDHDFHMRGLLVEEHHGATPDGVPFTRGAVRRIQMVTRPYIPAGERGWIPKPAEAELRDLPQSPPGFTDEETLPELRRIQTGLLVSLDVNDIAPEP